MIRTTISIPEDFHEELRLIAFREKRSLGAVLVEKARGRNFTKKIKSVDDEVDEFFSFFDRLAREGPQIDAVRALKEEREKRIEKLSRFI